ncbi:hypothetical protein Micbo1qcDRAFT_166135, partial [Microdochium bolleyi]
MPILNSRLLQSLAIIMRSCRDRDLRYRIMALAELVTTPVSTWDDKAMFIGSKVMVELEEKRRVSRPVTSDPSSTVEIDTTEKRDDSNPVTAHDDCGQNSGEPAELLLDRTVKGLPLETRIQWANSEWTQGHTELKLRFFYPATGEWAKASI